MVNVVFSRCLSLSSLLSINIGDEVCSEVLDQIPIICWRFLKFALVLLRPPGTVVEKI